MFSQHRPSLLPGLRRPCHLVAGLAAAVLLAGCGGSSSSLNSELSDGPTSRGSFSGTDNGTDNPSSQSGGGVTADDGPLLSVSIDGDEVLPNAEDLSIDQGTTLYVEVTSDRAGELHVHSSPEQYLEFDDGTTNAKLVIDTPGTIEIEDHDTSAVVAILEVS